VFHHSFGPLTVIVLCPSAEHCQEISCTSAGHYANFQSVSSREIREYLARVGRKGGAATAKARTPAERKEIARKAAHARWAKKKTNS
jgi:hypothetical protein